MKTKTITISKKWLREQGCSPEEVEKYAGKVKIRRWRYGAKKRAQSKAMEIDIVTKKTDFDVIEFIIWKFIGCIVEAPFPVEREEILELPDFLGEKIEDAVNEMIGITTEDLQNLGLPSNEES